MISPILHIANAGIHVSCQNLNLFCQLLDLSGNHGKTPSRFSHSSSLNRGIQSQNIRLVRDGHNLAHALADLLNGGLQLREGFGRLFIGSLHSRICLPQLSHLSLGNLYTSGNVPPYLAKLFGGLVDIGKGHSQIL